MLTTTTAFDTAEQSDMRQISWSVRAAFDKVLDPTVKFFTLDSSPLDGPDLLKGDGSVLQEWDTYAYTDYSDRVISVEWSRNEDVPFSVSLSIATIVFDNTDDFFTPGSGSAIDGNILPRRPFKISAGFKGERVSSFVGLNQNMPYINDINKTATFRCVDFLSVLFNKSLDQTTVLLDKTTDEILGQLLQDQGLGTVQFNLDTGRNTIPFAYFKKGSKFGDEVRKLIKAEVGYMFMDEFGEINFRNYAYRSSVPVVTYDGSNTLSLKVIGDSDVINTVDITSKVRVKQDLQPVWQSVLQTQIPAGGSLDVWADFEDPMVTVNLPTKPGPKNDSYFLSTNLLTVTGTLFTNSYLMTFTNAQATPVLLAEIELWGEPAKVTNTIRTNEVNQASIDKYEEQVYTIDSEYIQSEKDAVGLSTLLLDSFAEFNDTIELEVRANPAVQIGDPTTVNIDGINDTYYITNIDNRIEDGGFSQTIKLKNYVARDYFRLDLSQLDGTHVLGF